MRILVLNYEYPPLGGGASHVTQAICQELLRHGNFVDVVTMGFRGLPKHEDYGNLNIFRVPSIRSELHLAHFHEMLSYCASALAESMRLTRIHNYDLIHSHFILPCGAVAYSLNKMRGIPYVITAHGSDVGGYNPDRFNDLHRAFSVPWKRIVQNAEMLISPSRSLANLIENNYGNPIDVDVVPNGIQHDWLEPVEKEESILVVSRMFERKGVQYVLEALEDIPLGYNINIVGDGPYMKTLSEMAKNLPHRVKMYGWLDHDSRELVELYQKSSIFVFPSISENFPVSLLEAMLAGSAIIATDIGACKEVLGDAARFVPPRDSKAIGKQLVDLIKNSEARNSLGRQSRERVLKNFTWSRIGQTYQALFSCMLDGKDGSP